MTSGFTGVSRTLAEADLGTTMIVVLQILLALVGILVAVVGLRRATAGLTERRRARLAARTRPLLLQAMADESPDLALLARLASLPEREWRVVEPTLLGMLAKVRGAARESLVQILDQRGTLARAEAQARSWSWVRRCRAAEMLGAARRSRSVPVLSRLLSDRSDHVRRVAVRALGRVGGAAVVQPLLAATSGPPGLPLRDVAAALVGLEPDATRVLAEQARGADDVRVRIVVTEALGLRGAVEAADTVIAMLEHDADPEVRIRAARALGRIGVRAGTRPLVGALDARSPELRAVAARALGQLGDITVVERLLPLLSDPVHRVAANAAQSLAALGDRGHEALRAAVEAGDRPSADYAAEALALDALGRRPLERAGA